MQQRTHTRHIVLHCSATRPSQDVGAKDIRRWHLKRGWQDIGYHYVIRRDGVVERGRPAGAVGAHVEGHNRDTVGICLVGGIAEADPWGAQNNFTEPQWQALRPLLAELLRRFPQATILGHRDLSPDRNQDGRITPDEWTKQCPCFDARAWARAHGLPAAP